MIFLDMDGVLSDFCGGVGKMFGVNKEELYTGWLPHHENVASRLGVESGKVWARINSNPTFWSGLEPYPWVDELIEYLDKEAGQKLFICSSPGMLSEHAINGKVAWLKKYTGSRFRKNYFFTSEKWALAAPGRILVDDDTSKCKGFQACGGQVIQFPAKWNPNKDRANNPIEFVKEELERLRSLGLSL